MSQFIETIQVLHGELQNLVFHQERFERTRQIALGFKRHPPLAELINVPGGLEQVVLKCRVIYEKEIVRIEYEPYRAHKVRLLKMVYSDSIDYGFKYADRSELEELFHQRAECDDILIVKQGCITDSFYANVVFWDGREWITPDTPLLPGTMRSSLLRKGIIGKRRITRSDLAGYQKLKLINAMNDLQNAPDIPIESIH
jgi:4-amino-4-deoxychorismate lyase